MCSRSSTYACSIAFGVVDLLAGLAVLAFYSYQQYIHRYCTYAHGVYECEYFLFKSNHSTRVMIGIGEGLACMAMSGFLIFALYKRWGLAVWIWLLKPTVVIVLNLYFVVMWMIERGRYYHTYDYEGDEFQELLYIYVGAATAVMQVFLSVWYCCAVGVFAFQFRKSRRSEQISTETKV